MVIIGAHFISSFFSPKGAKMSQNWKRSLRLPKNFEILNPTDSQQEFQTGDHRMDKYTLRDYLDWNQNPNEVCIVYKQKGRVAGIIDITVYEGYIKVEMVGKNKLVDASGVGTKLMKLAENIARQLGRAEIRLESLDTVVGFYDEYLGYSEFAEPYEDEEFGRLTPKRKFVQG
jgi:histone acetyltransferase (RNA polymerase elongator complex component)